MNEPENEREYFERVRAQRALDPDGTKRAKAQGKKAIAYRLAKEGSKDLGDLVLDEQLKEDLLRVAAAWLIETSNAASRAGNAAELVGSAELLKEISYFAQACVAVSNAIDLGGES